MKLFRYILLFAAAAAVWACSLKEEMPVDVDEVPGISLSFFTQEDFAVKSDDGYTPMPGEDPLKENLLASVEYFLYPDGKTNQDAVIHGYLTDVRAKAPYSVPMTDVTVTEVLCPNNAKYFYIYAIANHDRIKNTEDLSGTSVAELEALTQELDLIEKDLDDGHVVSNQSKFLMATNGPLRVGPIKKRQTTVASAKVDLERVASKLSIVVRVEPQVTIKNITTVGEVTINRDELWEPRMSEVSIYLVNGAFDGQVSGLPLASPTLFEHAPIFFDYNQGENHSYSSYEVRKDDDGDPVDEQGRKINSEGYLIDSEGNPILDENNEKISSDFVYDEVVHNGTFYPAETPFYSYPRKWFYGSEDEPYLKITIPWDRVEYVDGVRKVKQSKQYYYRVYCPGSKGDGIGYDGEFLRNHWYKVILNVGILGSETDGGEIVIQGTYYVADWQEREAAGQGGSGESTVNDSDKEAEIKGARYLFVNQTEYELFNIDDLMIPYITSDPCEIVNFHAERYNFSGDTKQKEEITNMAAWGITIAPVTTSTGAHINFTHNLDNNLNGTTYDVSAYTITFRLRQISNPDYFKDITIHQYPAIRIDLEDNNVNTHYGYTYVNNGEKLSYVGNTNGTSSGNNTNFNMVIIETTVLPSDSQFLLGDPRTYYIDNIYYNRTNNNNTYNESYETWPNTTDAQRVNANNNWSASAAAIEGGTRQLRYYYPVDRSDAVNNIIAPKFRVASSHGATNALNYASAFRRCASYQEAGFPAGRWRLPTVAEVTYAMKLNADEKIQRLFGSGNGDNNGKTSEYWCNSGYITVFDGTDNASKQPPVAHPGVTTRSQDTYVRCVYDEWYWGSGKINNLQTFTWGDAER